MPPLSGGAEDDRLCVKMPMISGEGHGMRLLGVTRCVRGIGARHEWPEVAPRVVMDGLMSGQEWHPGGSWMASRVAISDAPGGHGWPREWPGVVPQVVMAGIRSGQE